MSKQSDRNPHIHGIIEPALLSSRKGMKAVSWSFLALMLTAVFQLTVVLYSGSVALLADTVHNFGDALTAVPLFCAFWLSLRPPSERYTYGLGRAEDLAGLFIVAVIAITGLYAGYESILRFFYPREVTGLWAIGLAGLTGFLGNELVARYRTRVGREIGSAALVADGQHARIDGLTSLAVLVSAIAITLGFPAADPLIGLGISAAILVIAWNSGTTVVSRILDGVDPELVRKIRQAVMHVPGVIRITEVRVRWLGHRILTELNITVNPDLSVEEGHRIAMEARQELLFHIPYLSQATIHVDPASASGEDWHCSNESAPECHEQDDERKKG
ncbi:MAG: cation transporter [Methanomicrobiales archaeon]|nr:cation transporter [Methanomicrobiales archaeon]